MPIIVSPSVSQVAAPVAAPAPVVLQPGTVISAKVLQVLGNNVVQIAIGGQPVDVLSQVPLQAGQTLQLAVSQTAGGIRLAVVDQQAGAASSQGVAVAAGASATSDTVTLAPNALASIAEQAAPSLIAAQIQLTPLEALAVSAAAQAAAPLQTSLAPLFANLAVAAGIDGLPPPVQQAVAQVLSQQLSLDPSLTGEDIRQAFQSSGLFLEASLATGSVSSPAATPDLKAALIVLRQVLTTSLGEISPPSVAPPSGAVSSAVVIVRGAAAPGSAPVVQQAAAQLQQQGFIAAPDVLQHGTLPFTHEILQPITIVPATPTTASPALAPLLDAEITASAASLQAAASPAPQGVLDFSTLSQILAPVSTLADAATRTAASTAAINLLQEALQAGPLTAANLPGLLLENSQMQALVPAVAGARPALVDEAEFARTNVPPPPISGALPAAQPVMAATLVSNSPSETAMHHLLADTDGAIARQTLLQVASLPGQTDNAAMRLDPTAPRWNFEIPFMTPQGTAMAQFEISRDSGGNEIDGGKRVWRARFSLDVEPAGPVHALISLSGERTSVRMWAERPATAAQLRAGTAQLSQALSRAELQPGEIVIRDGAPVQTAAAPAGHFLDRAL